MTQIHKLAQGSSEWHQFRAEHFGASEAAAMLGISPYMTRTELLTLKKTGIAGEVSAAQQRVFDAGHATEALARPIVEELIGDDLYPVTCSAGLLSASCDGLTADKLTAFEHKLWSEGLAAQVSAGQVPEHYMAQCQQILLVTGAERVIFVVSNGTRERLVSTIVRPDDAWFERLRQGWHQFRQDLNEFAPQVAEVTPTGKAPESLPALRIEVTGMVTASNLAEFKATALAAIGSVNRNLVTDQDFADADKAVKWCGEVEDRLAAAKQHALSQTASIDELFRAIDDISAEARRVRLDLDKLVKARKEAIRGEIVAGGIADLRACIDALNAAMPAAYMPQVPADFGGVVKGKRTVESLRDAVATELARAKIAAGEIANRIHANLRTLGEQPDKAFLFPDVAQIVLKQADDVRTLVAHRIAEHERKEAERLEAERARIRAEEEAKARREEQERQKAAAEEQARADREAQAAIAAAAAPPAPVQQAHRAVAMPAATPRTAEPEVRIKLGQINDRLSPLSITADGLSELGFEPVATERASKLYRESDFPRICEAIVKHVRMAAALQAA